MNSRQESEDAQRARWRREQRIRRKAVQELIKENPDEFKRLAQQARKEDS